MRVFVAVDLPQEAKDELALVQKQLSTAAAKMSPAHGFHLTMKFLGEVTPAKVEVVKSCLGNVRFKTFSAAVAGMGVFPSESYARVVWAGIEPEEDVIRLQQGIDGSLEKEFPKDKQFKPHITLARVKSVHDKNAFLQQLRQMKVKKIKFVVNSFKLKRSTLSREGAVYDDLAVYAGR